ncbi:MAG: hypothetical protein ACLPHP_08155 [Candidatus Sulfotelmatobacter sp.]
MPITIEAEINRAALLGQQLEDLVYNKSKEGKLIAIDKNDDLLMGYWSLIFDYGKGVGCLLQNRFYSPAFALFRHNLPDRARSGGRQGDRRRLKAAGRGADRWNKDRYHDLAKVPLRSARPAARCWG